jgi:hypothetical protein
MSAMSAVRRLCATMCLQRVCIKLVLCFIVAADCVFSFTTALFSCPGSDERGEEVVYHNVPISKVLSDNMGVGGVIALLWFQRPMPKVSFSSFLCPVSFSFHLLLFSLSCYLSVNLSFFPFFLSFFLSFL